MKRLMCSSRWEMLSGIATWMCVTLVARLPIFSYTRWLFWVMGEGREETVGRWVRVSKAKLIIILKWNRFT